VSSGTPRWPRNAPDPILVEMRRGGVVESRHRGAVVQVGSGLQVERALGDAELVVTLRSTVKPFGVLALVEAGAADAFRLTPAELALMSASHSGEDLHVRTLQGVFRRAHLSQELLGCGTAGAPLDALTATRLARDGERPGPVRHQCSGFHAASILLSRHAGWPVEEYWSPDHPSQVAVRSAVARVFGVRPDRLVRATDACGVETFAFPLVAVAQAYAYLADPIGVAQDQARSALAPAMTRIRDAMLAHPELVAGTRDRLDTALMSAGDGRIVSKGGAEGLRGIGLLAGARGGGSLAGGMAITIDDGNEIRAGRAATVEALRQVGGLDARALRQLEAFHRPTALDPRGTVVGEAVADFELAPISELA
jgi:L-asparaginase II